MKRFNKYKPAALVMAGILLGALAMLGINWHRSPQKGRVVTQAGQSEERGGLLKTGETPYDDDADLSSFKEDEKVKRARKKTIGRLEILDFPELELYGINAKVDTGAFTSSIHAHFIRKTKKNGVPHVSFVLLDPKHPYYKREAHEFKIHAEKRVKSSSGDIENRITIMTKVKIFDQLLPIELALTDRSYMKIPILLGRSFLKGRFMVDVAKSKQSYKSVYVK